MKDLTKQIVNELKKYPQTRDSLIGIFKNRKSSEVSQAINKLLINDKIIFLDGQYCIAKRNKYHNKIVEIDGIKFRSIAEGDRYVELRELQKTGSISNLQLQVPFIVSDKVDWHGTKLRAIKYYADFVYQENGKTIVEDRKGARTALYCLKRSLFINRYPECEFRES